MLLVNAIKLFLLQKQPKLFGAHGIMVEFHPEPTKAKRSGTSVILSAVRRVDEIFIVVVTWLEKLIR